MRRVLTIGVSALLTASLFACTGGGRGGTDPAPSDGGTTSEPSPTPSPDAAGCTIDDVGIVAPPQTAEKKTGGAPNLDCYDNNASLPAGHDVTLHGCVDIFGIGGKAKPGLKLAVFDADQNPTTETPAYGEVDIATKAQAGPLQAAAAACAKEGYYEITGIPTHTHLLMKVYDTATGPSQTAIPTYVYGLFFRDTEIIDVPDDNPDLGETVTYEASLVYKTTYDSIPTLGGKRVDGQQIIYDGVGRAVIAGEVRDCDGITIKYATVGSSLMDNSTRLVYMNGDPDDPTPDLTIQSTNNDGLYIVLNAATDEGNNTHHLVAGIEDPSCTGNDCTCFTVGTIDAQTFPDSVTIASFQGPVPIVQ